MSEQRIIVNGILQKDGLVFIAKRSSNKAIAPGQWHLPGGHVEFGEDAPTALRREFKEEFDLDIEVGDIIRTFSYIIGDAHTIGLSFRARCNNISEPISLTADNSAITWMSLEDIDEYFSPENHDYVTLSGLERP